MKKELVLQIVNMLAEEGYSYKQANKVLQQAKKIMMENTVIKNATELEESKADEIKKNARKSTDAELEAVHQILKTMPSREKSEELIHSYSRDELVELANYLKINIYNCNKERIREKIVESTTGVMIRTAALMGSAR